MSSLLILNDSFSTEMFNFKMLPPYCKEFKHSVQNGGTLIDRIAYKDRFEVLFPFLTQSQYNELMSILQKTSDPFLKLRYETDGLVRVWDSSTAFPTDIEGSVHGVEIHDYLDFSGVEGVLTARATTNLFVNPNGDSLDLTGVEEEDSVTTKKNLTLTLSTEQYLWGTHSFKADNSNTNDYTPESGSSASVAASEGRPGYTDSGALQISEGYSSLLKYNHHPFTTYSANWTTARGSIVMDQVYSPEYCYRTESISPASNTYTFQVSRSTLLLFGNTGGSITLTISDLAGQSASRTFYFTGWTEPSSGFMSVTKTFSGSLSTQLRVRVDFTNIDFVNEGSGQYLQMQLVQKSYPMPWQDTSAGDVVVVAENVGLLYKAPISVWGTDGIHYEPPTSPSDTQSPQSISFWFRSLGWDYAESYTQKFYLISSLDQSGHEADYIWTNSLFIEGGYLKLTVFGSTSQYQISNLNWDQLSWHHITLVTYEKRYSPLGEVTRPVYDVYLDNVKVMSVDGPYSSGLSPKFLGGKGYGTFERYFSIGRFFDLALSPKSGTNANIMLSEFVIGTSKFDVHHSNNYPSQTILQSLRSGSDVSSYLSLIRYDENFSFYLQGNSTSAYVARCVFFRCDFTNLEYEKFIGSCYVYPTKSDHRRLIMTLGYSVVDETTMFTSYIGGDAAGRYTLDDILEGTFNVNTWNRSSISSITPKWSTGGALSGDRRVFGVFVPIGEIYFVCGVQFETSGVSYVYPWYPEGPSPYCDGNQPNCVWDGAPSDSTSSRSATYLTLPFPSSITNSDSWSLLFSATLTEMSYLPGSGVFCTIGEDPTNKVTVGYKSDIYDSYIYLEVVDSSGNTSTIAEYRGWKAGQEHTVAVVRSASNRLEVYLDYHLIFTKTFVSIKTQLLNPSTIYIGATNPGDTNPKVSSMYIRNVSLWRQALTLDNLMSLLPNLGSKPHSDVITSNLVYFGSLSDDLVLNSSNKINADVRRLRKRVLCTSLADIAHFKNRANIYSVKAEFQES